MRACIVGDNVTIRDNLIGTREELVPIQTMGIAETEDEGTRWLARNDAQWDLAIVDLFLKEGSGLGVVKACRYQHANQRTVVLSNHATQEVRWRCEQLGADAVFDKSTHIDDLLISRYFLTFVTRKQNHEHARFQYPRHAFRRAFPALDRGGDAVRRGSGAGESRVSRHPAGW